ncbi:MAG: proton-conducting transporter membrane subunit, partial [Fibrobacteraceae bacterium]|nr:proton-conducting transporter membrane subunit [Fibrobacteraceae bacterium]
AVYGGLMALRGKDVKKILAFSSMGHLGLAVAAIFTFSPKMFPAILVLLVGHGLSAGSLFLLSGVAERMTGTRELSKMGGLVKSKPVFGFLFGAAGIIALAVPGTAGFIGEFLVMLSLWDVGPLPTLVGAICLVLSAAYMLRLIQGVIFGKANQSEENPVHLGVLEGSVIGAFLFLLLLFGLRPGLIYEIRTTEPVNAPVVEEIPTAVPQDTLNVTEGALENQIVDSVKTESALEVSTND